MKDLILGNLLLFCLGIVLFAGTGVWKMPGEILPEAGSDQLKYDEPKSLTGAIYAMDGKKLLYRFKRLASRSGSTLKVQRDFTYPDGRLAAQERVVYEENILVSYELDELQIGASGSAIIQRDNHSTTKDLIVFKYIPSAADSPKTRSEPLADSILINDMVGPFLASHWEDLQRGEKVKCRYLVVPRTESVGFTFVKVPGSAASIPNTLIVKMEVSSPFLKLLVNPLYFTMEQSPPHRVLQYSGRTTPKILTGNRWKDLDAITVFDW